jgi:hypothetical protein
MWTAARWWSAGLGRLQRPYVWFWSVGWRGGLAWGAGVGAQPVGVMMAVGWPLGLPPYGTSGAHSRQCTPAGRFYSLYLGLPGIPGVVSSYLNLTAAQPGWQQ